MEKSNIKVAFCPEHGLQFFDAQSRTCEHIPREENNMETINRIHQKVAKMNLSPAESVQVSSLVGQAFRAGMAEQADPLAGYSNLTAAIKAGEPIDWERLDGKRVQCVNPELGMIHGTLERHGPQAVTSPFGWWWRPGADYVYAFTFVGAWYGERGWTLYIEGEIPLRRKTADQLEPGHFFTGKVPSTNNENLMCVFVGLGNGKHVRYASDFMPSQYPASEWSVLEEYGPFQKPEGK